MRIHLHGVKNSPKTAGFVVISRSKLDPYLDDFLYVRVINSSQNVFFVGYRRIRNTRCVRFIIDCSLRFAGYDKTYTARVSYFAVTHPDPLRKLLHPVNFHVGQ